MPAIFAVAEQKNSAIAKPSADFVSVDAATVADCFAVGVVADDFLLESNDAVAIENLANSDDATIGLNYSTSAVVADLLVEPTADVVAVEHLVESAAAG